MSMMMHMEENAWGKQKMRNFRRHVCVCVCELQSCRPGRKTCADELFKTGMQFHELSARPALDCKCKAKLWSHDPFIIPFYFRMEKEYNCL